MSDTQRWHNFLNSNKMVELAAAISRNDPVVIVDGTIHQAEEYKSEYGSTTAALFQGPGRYVVARINQ